MQLSKRQAQQVQNIAEGAKNWESQLMGHVWLQDGYLTAETLFVAAPSFGNLHHNRVENTIFYQNTMQLMFLKVQMPFVPNKNDAHRGLEGLHRPIALFYY